MNQNDNMTRAIYEGPMKVFGARDPYSTLLETRSSMLEHTEIKTGVVVQFNVGMYSAKVRVSGEQNQYVCLIGAYNVTRGFGYSDACLLREGDEVIFAVPKHGRTGGMILAKKPDPMHRPLDRDRIVDSDTGYERRTSFLSSDCYRPSVNTYSTPLRNKNDRSSLIYTSNRPTDMVPGESGTLNQHRCGWLGGLYSMTILGGGSSIRMSALDNRIRVVADSIIKHTMSSNEYDWHSGRYLSREKYSCIYQEERLGLGVKDEKPFEDANYHKEGYFTKNKKDGQTARPRISELEGYSGNLYARYFSRPDPDNPTTPRTVHDSPIDPGVARESIDPSGQYRFAATGMIGTERIGRIPVPVRKTQAWARSESSQPATTLSEFMHSESHPFYRQLELADRVAYDMKNSYARVDEDGGFYVPQEQSIEQGRLRDVYDEGFTKSKTVILQKYDRRRSGIWQGEDGSIILRDAWGSEIVMIGGNIQLSCAGNVQIMPGKTAMTIAGDDIVQKAHHSIDIHAAQNDVRIDAAKNVQIMAGIDDKHPGGVTIEAVGKASTWSAEDSDGGEEMSTRGVLIKSSEGSIVTDTKTLVLRSKKNTSVVSGDESVDGTVMLSANNIHSYGEQINLMTGNAFLLMSDRSTVLTGGSVLVAGQGSCTILSGEKVLIPLMWIPIGKNFAEEIADKLQPIVELMSDEERASMGYSRESLDEMKFVFRSSGECGTDKSWEIGGGDAFTLYEPFWVQVSSKFETLNGISTKVFDDNYELWDKSEEERGCPWPGEDALYSAKYAQISGLSPVNMDSLGFNRNRGSVEPSTSVSEIPLRTGYLVRR